MPGGDPNGPKRLANDPISWIDEAIRNIDLALDDHATPESARPDLTIARGYLLKASQAA